LEEPLKEKDPDVGTSRKETRAEEDNPNDPPSRIKLPYPHIRKKNLIIRKKMKNFRDSLNC